MCRIVRLALLDFYTYNHWDNIWGIVFGKDALC